LLGKEESGVEFSLIKIALVAVAAMLYYFIFTRINRSLKKGSRASQFKVGGSRLDIEKRMKGKETREERRKRGEVSLRDGPMWKRRLR